ncbi:taurine catabolism dioxygenase TauD [Pyricularia oryzae 70-15]|uniref:Taurine catabolism dioxygenase TauD n=1 Tax=Pyricularia oryzae (strain 70-15 / ATCC MYA-4617 / FGSC 8958) TaxID=242507 RepID=G4N2M5_PYRO7|nr:taurine catabolism dioxygenase TauD [Pyricularia oryzae 70-15]EHA51734.1 taurine catabolism dioxygenase TauD [Pyricularia oryzae 70-15]KAI7914425.1 taurine catabolism dioxygenase TauD [Pyricularia oryzae]
MPGLVEVTSGSSLAEPVVDKAIFPDGIKTSGQHAPVYSKIRPYEDFPKEITGITAWNAKEFVDKPEKWTYSLSNDDVAEIGAAADRYIESGQQLTAMSKDLFQLPNLASRMKALKALLLDGQGFWLFKNIPVQEWGLQKCATAYMGLGAHLGYFVSQNGRGHVLGHVKDLGEDPTKTDRVRIYRTNARQYFHTDAADLVGLLCIARSMEGGESDIVSQHQVWNVLQREYPEVARLFTQPIWYLDRKGEVSEGQEPWIRASVFYLDDEGRLFGKFDPNNVTSLARYNTGPDAKIPPLSEEQKTAIDVLEKVCKRESLHMILQPGDIQWLSNRHVFHARTAYTNWPEGSVDEQGKARPARHLMRLWLSVPISEGGWKLPYADSHRKKRDGIQVNDTPPICPLDAE